MAAGATEHKQSAGDSPWRKLAFALLTVAYFLYFNWNGLWVRFAEDDMENMVRCWRLLVVSATAPHKPDWCPTDCFQTKPIADAFFEHPRYRFSLRANPTKKIIDPEKPKVIQIGR